MLGSLQAHPDLALIWVDAHADINTPDTTDSGNLLGCPVSFLLGLDGTHVEPFSSWLPAKEALLKPNRLVYIGLRDVDAGEKVILKQNNIKSFSMHEVDKWGIGRVMEMALDYINDGQQGKRERPIHLSFDVDAVSTSLRLTSPSSNSADLLLPVSDRPKRRSVNRHTRTRRPQLPRSALHLRSTCRIGRARRHGSHGS